MFFRILGGSEAQESLQKFTDFLETEASRGRISRAFEKKILGKSKIKIHKQTVKDKLYYIYKYNSVYILAIHLIMNYLKIIVDSYYMYKGTL